MSKLLPAPGDAVPALQEYLDHSIPLLRHMQVAVSSLDAHGLVITAPLEPNRNHIGTAFGGSLNSLATLAAWGLVWLLLLDRDAQIVIHEGTMKFRKPALDDFSARCRLPNDAVMQDFVERYRKKGRSRIQLAVDVICQGKTIGEFHGSFAAIRKNA